MATTDDLLTSEGPPEWQQLRLFGSDWRCVCGSIPYCDGEGVSPLLGVCQWRRVTGDRHPREADPHG